MNPSVAIPAAGQVQSRLSISGTESVERIEVEVAIAHARRSQRVVRLLHLDGTAVVLRSAENAAAANLVETFPTLVHEKPLVAPIGKPGQGTWPLEVVGQISSHGLAPEASCPSTIPVEYGNRSTGFRLATVVPLRWDRTYSAQLSATWSYDISIWKPS